MVEKEAEGNMTHPKRDLTKIVIERNRKSSNSTISLEFIPGVISDDLYLDEGRCFGVRTQ